LRLPDGPAAVDESPPPRLDRCGLTLSERPPAFFEFAFCESNCRRARWASLRRTCSGRQGVLSTGDYWIADDRQLFSARSCVARSCGPNILNDHQRAAPIEEPRQLTCVAAYPSPMPVRGRPLASGMIGLLIRRSSVELLSSTDATTESGSALVNSSSSRLRVGTGYSIIHAQLRLTQRRQMPRGLPPRTFRSFSALRCSARPCLSGRCSQR
jgi:hypothetical protein